MKTPDFQSAATALSIAGSDNSAGAGIQADLKTFGHFGVYGLTAVTCVVAEVPGLVQAISPVDPEIVAAQIALCLEHFPVGAIKTGMLYSTEIIEAVIRILQESARGIPLVIDPVMVASSGNALLEGEAVEAYRSQLLPMATLATPNLDEAAVLLSWGKISTVAEMEVAGRELSGRFGTAFLMKGGHLPGGSATDLLVSGNEVHRFEAPFIEGVMTHGTGCTYSAAIASQLALGASLSVAVENAKRYISSAIAQSFLWRKRGGLMALNHFAQKPL